MNRAASRKSRRLQGSSNDTPSEDISYHPTAEHGENTESETEKPPRGKKRKVTKKDVVGRRRTIKKVRGTRGMLKNVKEMPLDILFEIFSLLNPIDLVNLTRTSKDLRAMLMSRASISVWKSARANVVPPMPHCPDDLSEPQYAELAFGNSCYYCQRRIGTIRTVWSARRRICYQCIKTYCDEWISEPYASLFRGSKDLVPVIEVPTKSSSKSAGLRNYYFTEFSRLWLESYKNITTFNERQSWIKTKVEERTVIQNHALLCATWVKEFAEYQQILADEIIQKRKNDVAKRVAFLGWGDEILKMLPDEKKFEDRLEMQNIYQKELTDRRWLTVDAQINEYMESVKQGRLKREREAFLKDRLPILQKVHDDHLLTFPTAARYWYPMASELFLHEPKIQDIVNNTSSTLKSMKEQLVLALPKIYPDSISQLIRRIDDQLLEAITADRPEELIDRENGFDLATTVFECSDCSRYYKRILRYSEAVLHSCTRKFDFPQECEDREYIAKYLEGKYRSHTSSGLSVSKTALKLVPILVKLCGLDPRTTTAKMMDDLNPIFECISCEKPAEGYATMTWLRAVDHFVYKKHDFDIKEGMKLERLNEDEEDAARKRIIETQERARASATTYDNPLMQCAHCLATSSKANLRRHVKSEHGIEKPTDKDLMLNVDANHIPDIFYMWPPRNPEGEE